MEKYIKKIEGQIPNTLKKVEVVLNGKNLIITGQNGSGKTSFLREIHKKTAILIVQKSKLTCSNSSRIMNFIFVNGKKLLKVLLSTANLSAT